MKNTNKIIVKLFFDNVFCSIIIVDISHLATEIS